MDAGGMVGTTVTVGSVAELANILANMPPEQLQNVQLDPILYNALFQTLDSNPQILDGNDQVVDNGTDQESAAAQQVNKDGFIKIDPKTQVRQKIVSTQQTPTSVVSSQSAPAVKINKPSSTNKLHSQSTGKVLSSHSTSTKASISSSNVVSKSRETLQPKRTSVTPIGEKHVKKNEVDTNTEISQGILPGQCSSLIVTPTVMSQVLPTATIQPMKLNENGGSNQCTQVVTLPSNAYLQPTITHSLKVENGQVTQVGDASMSNVIQGITHGTKKNSRIPSEQLLSDGNVVVSHTIASNSIPQIPALKEVNSNFADNPQYLSIPAATTLHENTEISQHNQSSTNNICVDNTSAIVLTAEQLSEIMGGKSLEEVLQGTISEQGLESVLVVESTDLPNLQAINTISDVGINKSRTSNVQGSPIKSTETKQAEQNVFEIKYNSTKIKQNHVLPRTSVKPKLSPQNTTQVPLVKRQVDDKNMLSDIRKVLTPKAQLADIKRTLHSVLPLNTTKASTTISSISQESKGVTTSYTKISAFTPYRPSTTQSGMKSVYEKQQGRIVVASGTPVNQNINIPSNKNMPEPPKGNKVYEKQDTLYKSIFKSPSKKIYSSDKIPPPQEHKKQNKTVSPANIIRSVIHNPVINKGENKRYVENHKKPYVLASDVEREKADLIKSGKVLFSRSFKKTPSVGESKKRIKKTLKEMEKTYPKEVNEILTIREAIKSSHVGDGESAMRQLAKLEIENQLKRFSQKVNAIKNASPEKRIDYRRRKIHAEVDKSNRTSKTDTQHDDANEKDNKKTDSGIIKDHVRKRERPKKFDDFVLGSKPKKEKKSKSRKFFFPEDLDDKTEHGDEDDEPTLDEVSSPSTKIGPAKQVAAGNLENKSVCNNDIKEVKPSSISPSKEKNISLENAEKEKKENLSSSIPGTVTVEKEEKTLKNKTDFKSISPDKKEKDSSKTSSGFENKKILPDTSFEERSFMDAISSDVTPTVKVGETLSENHEENEKLPDKVSNDLDQDVDDEKDTDKDEESIDDADQDTTTPKEKTNNKVKKKKRKKKKAAISYEPEVLPAHLKKKPKLVVEETVIDLSKVQTKSSCIESSFELSDTIELETFELLKRNGWACTFCGKPGNIGNLDVLFGPYVVKVSNSDGEKNKIYNAWMHRDCAIWTSSICLSNHTLCGLGEALTTAAKMACSLCTKVGATLQCSSRQCRDNYHFVCAKQRGCSFKIENFTITCPKHK